MSVDKNHGKEGPRKNQGPFMVFHHDHTASPQWAFCPSRGEVKFARIRTILRFRVTKEPVDSTMAGGQDSRFSNFALVA